MVIDHKYNSVETSGALGDFLFRLGNPRAYKDTLSNILFDRIHTPNLIPAGYPGSRNLLVFNNGHGVVTGQSSKRVAEMAVRHWAAQLDEEGALA